MVMMAGVIVADEVRSSFFKKLSCTVYISLPQSFASDIDTEKATNKIYSLSTVYTTYIILLEVYCGPWYLYWGIMHAVNNNYN